MKGDPNYTIMGADFETDYRILPDGRKEGFVCQWAIARADGSRDAKNRVCTYARGYTLSEFETAVRFMFNAKSMRYIIYFHNLKYDLQFMRGFIRELMQQTDESETILLFRNDSPIRVKVGNVEFRDSLKKVPGHSVADLGRIVGLPKLESPRGNFDMGWSKDLTDNDFAYVEHDAQIVALMMKEFHEQKHTACTISGDAWKNIRTIFNRSHTKTSRKGNDIGQWKQYFPPLEPKTDAWLRPGYYGGLNISWIQGRIDGPLCHVDRHSMYPSVMAGIPSMPSGTVPILPYGGAMEIPIGEIPDVWCKQNGYPLFVIKGWCKLRLKQGMKPWFKFKNKADCVIEGIQTSDSVVNCKHYHQLTLTNVDVETIAMFYEIIWDDASETTALAFKGEAGLFKDYVDEWYAVKKESASGSPERTISKLMLNSAYGRFGMSNEGEATSIEWSDDMQDYVFTSMPETIEEVDAYLPVAMFVTAWARRALIEAVLTVGVDNVIHCDTDSVIFKGTSDMAKPIGISDELGDWGDDYKGLKWMIEGGVKRYMEFRTDEPRTLDDLRCTCAGVPQKSKDGVPYGMWLELLDDPMRICNKGEVLGHEHYRVSSEWLRELLISAGKDPDDQRTFKTHSGRSTWIKGGVTIEDTDTFTICDMMRSRWVI